MKTNNPRMALGDKYDSFVQDVQGLKGTFKSGDVIEIIYLKYHFIMTKDQVRYYSKPHLSHKERLAKYRAENKLMDIWNGNKETKEDSDYAEELFKLSRGQVLKEDFDKIAKNSKVC